jgi:hypothetical protein
MAEQNHRSQPAMAGEFFREISSVNTAIAGGWVQTFGACVTTSFFGSDFRPSPLHFDLDRPVPVGLD